MSWLKSRRCCGWDCLARIRPSSFIWDIAYGDAERLSTLAVVCSFDCGSAIGDCCRGRVRGISLTAELAFAANTLARDLESRRVGLSDTRRHGHSPRRCGNDPNPYADPGPKRLHHILAGGRRSDGELCGDWILNGWHQGPIVGCV